MSHYFALVVAPGDDAVEEVVATAMEPHRERWLENDDRLVGVWDWYQIGGRWTGALDGYDPAKDVANVEPCRVCHGAVGGCGACNGTGVATKWPTDWAKHPGDIATARAALERDVLPYALVVDGEFYAKSVWNGDDFVDTPDWDEFVRGKLREAGDTRVIVVDYHS